MAQADLGTLSPSETSGTELAARLRSWRDANHSLHSGNARPSYAVPGTLWLNTSADPWRLMLWTGTVDAEISTTIPSSGLTSTRATRDLSTALASKVDRSGDTFTGSIGITTASPQIAFTASGARLWTTRVTRAGTFDFTDESGSRLCMQLTTDGNVVFPNVPGRGAVSVFSIYNALDGKANLFTRYGATGVLTGTGSVGMTTTNHADFHWNNGFFYRVDGNQYQKIGDAASDRKLKKDIEPVENATATLMKLKPVTYEFIDDLPIATPKGSQFGFVAQDVRPILPSAVVESGMPGGEEGETYLSLTDSGQLQMIALLVASLKEAVARIEALEAR